jgi:hypothetical protein
MPVHNIMHSWLECVHICIKATADVCVAGLIDKRGTALSLLAPGTAAPSSPVEDVQLRHTRKIPISFL